MSVISHDLDSHDLGSSLCRINVQQQQQQQQCVAFAGSMCSSSSSSTVSHSQVQSTSTVSDQGTMCNSSIHVHSFHPQQLFVCACFCAAGPKATDEASVFRYHPAFKFGEQRISLCCGVLGFVGPFTV
jgi:hypothetical protein